MGFFGSLFSGVGRAVKKAGNMLGKAVEKIGETVHSDAIEMAGFNLRCTCDFGESSWNVRSSTEQTVDVHKELNKIIDSISPDASANEEQLIQLCIKEVGEILDGFLTITPASELLRMKENYETDIRAELAGQVMKFAQPRLSLDNNECKKILGIQNDSERKRQAAEFKETVLKSAADQFKQRCQDVKQKYCEKMLELSEGLLKCAKQEYEKQKAILEQMLQEDKNEEAIDLERAHALLLHEKLALLGALAFEREEWH